VGEAPSRGSSPTRTPQRENAVVLTTTSILEALTPGYSRGWRLGQQSDHRFWDLLRSHEQD
jgi:hypothetical protein